MLRPWPWLTLIVALSGTPLRIAEAAGDLARSTADSGESSTIGEVDGGVGDEADETIRADAHLDPAPAEAASAAHPFAPPALFRPLLGAGPPPARPPPGPGRRYALLQHFLC